MGRSGLLSSVTAALSLMVASVIVLLVVSSLVAFRGWTGDDSVGSSKGAVSIAQVQPLQSPQRQRVVLGVDSSRRATRRSAPAAGSARRRDAAPTRAAAITGPGRLGTVRRTTQAAQPREQPQGEVLGVSVSSDDQAKPVDGGAPPPPTAGRDQGPLDEVIGGTVRPLHDLVEALLPRTP